MKLCVSEWFWVTSLAPAQASTKTIVRAGRTQKYRAGLIAADFITAFHAYNARRPHLRYQHKRPHRTLARPRQQPLQPHKTAMRI
jgi:hypothetical protein